MNNEKEKGIRGRPAKYDPSMVQKVDEYILGCGRGQTKLPKRVDIALLLGVDEDTLNSWGKKQEEFLGALSRVDNYQKSQLMDDGLYGGREVNSNMAIFLLKANHGMIETNRTEFTGKDGKPIETQTNIVTYGVDDPLQLRSQDTQFASDPRFTTPGKISNTQLAQESSEDNPSD